MLSREEREEVMRAVRALPDRQREALVLRFYLDLPEREIARIMGLRPGLGQVRHAPRPACPRPVPGGDAMTLEDKLRTALRETAGEIPDDPPPLRLSPLAVSRRSASQRPCISGKHPGLSGTGPHWPPGPPRWPPRPRSWAWSRCSHRGARPPERRGPLRPGLDHGVRPGRHPAVLRRPDHPRELSRPGCCRLHRGRGQGDGDRGGAGADHGAQAVRALLRGDRGGRRPHLHPGRGGEEQPAGSGRPYYPPSRFFLLRIDPAAASPAPACRCGPSRPATSRPTTRCTT